MCRVNTQRHQVDLLKISCWNVNGLIRNSPFFNKCTNPDFLSKLQSCEIIILTETWVDTEILIPGFKFIWIPAKKSFKKSGRLSGGLMFGFKTHLEKGISKIKETDNYLWCKLDKNFFNLEYNIYVCGIYIPPYDSPYFNPDIFTDLEKDISKFSTSGLVMLAGDLNSRTGKEKDFVEIDNNLHASQTIESFLKQNYELPSRQNFDSHLNKHGKCLLELCKTCELRILNGRTKGDSLGKITYHSPLGISTIDYFIASHDLYPDIERLTVQQPNIFSDHSQLTCWIKSKHSTSSARPEQINKLFDLPKQYIWNKESKEIFYECCQHNDISSRIEAFNNSTFTEDTQGIDLATEQLTHIINEISNRSLKISVGTKYKKLPTRKRWFDEQCNLTRKNLKLISNSKHRNPHDTKIRLSYHQEKNNYKKLLKMKKNNFQNAKIEELIQSGNCPQFWDNLKSMKDENRRTSDDIPLNKLQKHLMSLHSEPKPENLSPLHKNIVNERKLLEKEKTKNDFLDAPIKRSEIETAVKMLKTNKTAGLDKIKNEMLKCSFPIMGKSFNKLFNLILKSGIFPITWSKGIITAIHKNGNRDDPTNYRGICINSCLGKLFCLILNNRLQNYVLENKMLHQSQIGFLPKNRTSDHIFSLKTIIDKNVTYVTKGKIFGCFVDFKKAFDSIWHDGLLHKLLSYNISGNFYNVIKSMYTKSECCIKSNNQRTEFFPYDKGVRQGCIISPMLFNIYLNELPNILENSVETDPIKLPNGSNLNCLLYADDLLLISHSAKGLQHSLNLLSSYCDKWILNVNPKKTKIVIFQKQCRKSTINKHCFTIDNNNIEIVKNYTYLGVNIASNGNFRTHKEKLKEKTKRSIFATRKYLDFSKLPIKIINKLFESLFLPILLYCSEIWGIYDNDNLKSWENDTIEKTHAYFCKLVLGVNKRSPNVGARNELGRVVIRQAVDTNILKFWSYLENKQEESIAHQCLIMSKELTTNGKHGLLTKVHSLIEKYNLDPSLLRSKQNLKAILPDIKISIRRKLDKHQMTLIQTNRKLQFYSIFKKDTKPAESLDQIKNSEHKRQLQKLKLGNHTLRIETGRHTIPRTPEDKRLCLYCEKNKIEDEQHLMLECDLYKNERCEFFDKINSKFPHFRELTNQMKFMFLFNSIDPLINKLTAAFIYNSLKTRKYKQK